MEINKVTKRQRRKLKTKYKIANSGKARLVVYRSNKHIYAQIIDDVNAVTLASSSDKAISKGKPVERAEQVGKDLGEKAVKAGVKAIVFDRNGYKYHGRVKALADGARSAGLEF